MGLLGRKWQVAKIAGFPIEINATFLFLLAIVFLNVAWGPAVSSLLRGNPVALVLGLVVGLLVMAALAGSIVLHELGHAIVARRRGVRIGGIELQFFGGVATMVTPPRRALDEMAIAIAGPLVSFGLAAAGIASGLLIRSSLLIEIGVWNLILGGFNLLPALPMDGGRILRAYLARRQGVMAATRRAVEVSKWVALALGAIGLLTFNMLLAVVALMVYLMSRVEAQAAFALRYSDVPAEPTVVEGGDPFHRFAFSRGAEGERRFGGDHRAYPFRR
jgi:Zn-dependent protease